MSSGRIHTAFVNNKQNPVQIPRLVLTLEKPTHTKQMTSVFNKTLKAFDEQITKLEIDREQLALSSLPKIVKPLSKTNNMRHQLDKLKKHTTVILQKINEIKEVENTTDAKRFTAKDNEYFLTLIKTTAYPKIKTLISNGHGLHERNEKNERKLY